MAKQPPPDEEDGAPQDGGAPAQFGGMSPEANPAPDDSADSSDSQDGGASDDQGGADDSSDSQDQSSSDDSGGSDDGSDPGADSSDASGGAPAAAGGQGQKAPPALQAEYNQFIAQGWHVMYNGGRPNPAILNQLKAGDPKRCLALAAVDLVLFLVQSAKAQGKTIDGAVILHGGKKLFEELADLSAKMKIHQYQQGELDASWVLAMHMAQQKMQQAGLIDPKAFVRDVQEMNKAEAEGRIDDILPGLGKLSDEVHQGVAQKGGGQAGQQGGGQGNPNAQPVGAADDASEGAGSDMQGAGDENTSDASGDASSTDAEDAQKPGFRGFGG